MSMVIPVNLTRGEDGAAVIRLLRSLTQEEQRFFHEWADAAWDEGMYIEDHQGNEINKRGERVEG